ncbi:MAG: MerR family transcriptional regulator [Gammaproteobacteria bacterium]|nr:MerR family transcriptional regulator [Gammaproteobacteria bacterium]
MNQDYTIKNLSRDFEITPRALRFYEDKGILNPSRRGTTRLYSERDRTRLKLTLRGKRLGLKLEECREIIDMYDPRQPDDSLQLLKLCEKIREHRASLVNKIKDIEETMRAMDEVEGKCLQKLIKNVA